MNELIIKVRDVAKIEVLGGAINGLKHVPLLAERLPLNGYSGRCFLDFDGIGVATSSYLREAILGFRNITLQRRPAIYPIIANANGCVIEELQHALGSCNEAIWVCDIRTNGKIENARVVGNLDPVQLETFKLVQERLEVSAPLLSKEQFDGKQIAQTAWSNRLAALARKALVQERPAGKVKIYVSLWRSGDGLGLSITQ